MAAPDLDPEAFAALFSGKPNHNSRRYTLEQIDGQLVFRLCGIDAIFEAVLNEIFELTRDLDEYNTVIPTDVGPKRFFDPITDRARRANTESSWEFAGRFSQGVGMHRAR